jgi:hypothetical protein
MTITFRGQVTVAPHRARYLAQRIAGMTKRDCSATIVELADRLCMLEDLGLLGPSHPLNAPPEERRDAHAPSPSVGPLDTNFIDAALSDYMPAPATPAMDEEEH